MTRDRMEYIAERCARDGLTPPIGLDDVTDRVVVAIIADVTNRSGWDGDWDSFDAETRRDIVNSWRECVTAAMSNSKRDEEPDGLTPAEKL
jgi:hypothetical protein